MSQPQYIVGYPDSWYHTYGTPRAKVHAVATVDTIRPGARVTAVCGVQVNQGFLTADWSEKQYRQCKRCERKTDKERINDEVGRSS